MLSLLLISLVVSSRGFRQIHHTVGSKLCGSRRIIGATSLRVATSEVPKPVILLDVDGVINIRNDRLDEPRATLLEHHILSLEYAGTLWEDLRVKTVTKGNTDVGKMIYSPTVVNKINAWSEHAEIRWLTAWGQHAPSLLAPLMGINAFPCLPYVHEGNRPPKSAFAQQLADEVGPDRLIIWLDDDLTYWLPRRSKDKGAFLLPHVIWKHDTSTRTYGDACVPTSGADIILRPNTLYVGPWCGLSPKHLDLVDKYLADPSLAAGKAIYELDGGFYERAYAKGELLKEGERLDTYQSIVVSDFSNTVTFPL